MNIIDILWINYQRGCMEIFKYTFTNLVCLMSSLLEKGGYRRKAAFTLAEALITLAIIGVVAAITIPNVVAKYQKKQVAIQLKKTFSDLENAIRLSEIDNGDMNEWDYSATNNTEYKAFIEKYLQPYFKSSTIKSYWQITEYRKNGPSLILSDGRMLSFQFTDSAYNWIFVDLNGTKSPNIAGKDVFVLDIKCNKDYNPEGRLIFWAANCGNNLSCLNGTSWNYACNSKSPSGNGNFFCGKIIQLNNWEIPDNYPW